MIKLSLALLITVGVLIGSGCALTQPHSSSSWSAPATLYESLVIDTNSRQPVSLEETVKTLSKADVVVIGEYHGHQASHLLQTRVLRLLHALNPHIILSMEQFNLDHQDDLDDYLAGHTGEAEMIKDANAWNHYRGSYRPMVEYARSHKLPVIAANAPAQTVRCVGRVGPDYINELPEDQRQRLPAQPFLDTPAYREKFIGAISGSHGSNDPAISERMANIYKAQLLRDNTMASRILQARNNNPEHQILHVTGTFHSEEKLGTVALLQKRAPALSVAVLSPVFWAADQASPPLAEHWGKGDFLYLIQPLPPEFRDHDRRQKAMKERFKGRSNTDCDVE
ncbi:ChaN family lipoprotein [Marinobacter sp.]|uniref:ChaN family lipoprotein n=1 Tax=Marinobacter sp. TaxID=50741 RepID=UPI002B26BAF8|nr:ChaN family lipoprotein [Marinobacter sp.]